MSDQKSDNLAEWANTVEWEKYAKDKEVKKTLKELKTRIDTIKAEGGADDDEKAEDDDEDAKRIKLVVVGDGAVGKTCLLISFATGEFPEEYLPTVFENYSAKMKIGEKIVFLHLWDTAGQEDFDRLRPLSYPNSDIVLLCFSTTSKSSYDSVTEKWFPEVSHYLPKVPFILVGTKVDLREAKAIDPNAEHTEYVSKEQGEALAKEIGANKYMEVSAKTRFNLQDIFQEAMTIVLDLDEDEDDAKMIKSEPEAKAESSKNSNSAKSDGKKDNGKARKKGCVLL